MRQLKLLGIAFVASLSLTISAATAAQAVELKFLPEKAKFTFKSTGSAKLVRLGGGESIECSSVEGTGEATSERLGIIDLLVLGCKSSLLKVACTGLADTVSGSILIQAEYHLRHLLSPHEEDTILVILITGDGSNSGPAHYSCLGVLFTLSGCFASDDLKKNTSTLWLAGELVESFLANFLQSGGDAVITSIDTDNSLGMEACILLSKQEAKAAESMGQELALTFEKCKSGGAACTFLIDLSGTQ